jgi:hypothetical protein
MNHAYMECHFYKLFEAFEILGLLGHCTPLTCRWGEKKGTMCLLFNTHAFSLMKCSQLELLLFRVAD